MLAQRGWGVVDHSQQQAPPSSSSSSSTIIPSPNNTIPLKSNISSSSSSSIFKSSSGTLPSSSSSSSSFSTSSLSPASSSSSAEAEAMNIFRDLDKGLRSTVMSQQCESIVRFSDLILKYPLPTITNTALLRLAEFFRSTDNNFVRYWILVVFNEVRNEFDKALNKNELTKRISSVLGSNDPIARALTLRMLAAMSTILSERIDLQHKIETSLWSCVDDVEREASISAIEQICARSKRFANHILPEMQKLVHDIDTPMHSKLQLIKIFRYMYGTASMAKKAFDTCANLIEAYPTKDIVLTVLDTVTQLALNNFIVAPQVLSLLFALLERDVRKAVKVQCLHDIIRLSKKLSDPVTITYPVRVICAMLVDTPFESMKLLLLKLLKTLSYSPVMVRQWFSTCPDLIKVCEQFLFHAKGEFVDHSTALLINIARYSNDAQVVNQLGHTIKTSLYLSIDQRQNDKLICEYIIRFIGTFANDICMELTKHITTTMIQCVQRGDDDTLSVHLYSLCLLKYTTREKSRNLIRGHCDQLLQIVRLLLQRSESVYSSSVRNLIVALLQSQNQNTVDPLFIDGVKQLIEELIEAKWLWTVYEVAKHAATLGYHNLTVHMFSTVASVVENELYYFWNMSLSKLCAAEYELSMVGETKQADISYSMRSALMNYDSALEDIQNCLTAVNSRFQMDFIQLRIAYCALMQNILLQIRNVVVTKNATDGISRTTRGKFAELSHEMSSLGNQCRLVVFSYFDIDDQSRVLLSQMELLCSTIAQSITTICESPVNNNDSENDSGHHNDGGVEEDHAMESFVPPSSTSSTTMPSSNNEIYLLCNKITGLLDRVPASASQRMNMLQSIVLSSLAIGFRIPKFYYQTQLNTSLRMEVEVNGKNIQKSTPTFVTTVGVLVDQGLAIKFSGYVQLEETSRKQKVKRTPKAVRICIRQMRPLSTLEEEMQQQQQQRTGAQEKEIIVPIVNNSFQVQSMCNFEQEGKYRLTINTQIVDEDDMRWNTLASERMLVQVKPISTR